MATGAAAGTKFYYGTAGVSPVYTEVKDVSNLGDIGTNFAKIAVESLGDGYTRQIKGTASAPSFTVTLNRNPTDPGQILLQAAAADRNTLFNFKVVENDAPTALSAVVTITIAAPGVVSWTAHGLAINSQVIFSTTGALPTGLTAGTVYFVSATGFTANAFSVSLTAGGAAITTTGTQSGVHTATSVPAGTTSTFKGRVYGFATSIGSVNDLKKVSTSVEVEPDTIVQTAAVAFS